MPKYSVSVGSPTTLSGAHDLTGTDGLFPGVFVTVAVTPSTSGHSFATFTRTLQYGPSSTSAISLGAVDCEGTPNGWIELFYLIDPPDKGNYNLTFTNSVAVKSIIMESISYTGVSQVTPGSFTTNNVTSTSCNVIVAAAPGKYVVAGFACAAAISGTVTGGNNRLLDNIGTSGNAQNSLLADGSGSGVVSITATTASSANWGAVGCCIDAVTTAQVDHQALTSSVVGSLTGAPIDTPEASVIDRSLVGVAANVAAHSTQIGVIQSQLLATSSGGMYASVDFNNFADGAIPGMFDVIQPTTGNGSIGVLSGASAWTVGGSQTANQNAFATYNQGFTNTDYQIVSIVLADLGPGGIARVRGRVNNSTGDQIYAVLEQSSDLSIPDICEIHAVYGGVDHLISTGSIPVVLQAGARYSLICGTAAGVRVFQLLCNSALITACVDTGSSFGPSNRAAGYAQLSIASGDPTNPIYTPPTIKSFSMTDNQLISNFTSSPTNLSGTLAKRPAAGIPNRVYYCTDCDAIYTDNGSTWTRIKLGENVGPPLGDVPTTGWTRTNMVAGSSFNSDKDGMLFTAPVAQTGLGFVSIPYPTGPFVLTTYMDFVYTNWFNGPVAASGYWFGGIVVSDGTHAILLGQGSLDSAATTSWYYGPGPTTLATYWAQFSVNTSYYNSWNVSANWSGKSPKWFQYGDDGTTRTMQWSTNGLDWNLLAREARTNLVTPTLLGFGGNNSGGDSNFVCRLRSWNLSPIVSLPPAQNQQINVTIPRASTR